MRKITVVYLLVLMFTTSAIEAKCCRVCRGSKKACGHYCVLTSKECKKPKGCACDAKKHNKKRRTGNRQRAGWGDNLTN